MQEHECPRGNSKVEVGNLVSQSYGHKMIQLSRLLYTKQLLCC